MATKQQQPDAAEHHAPDQLPSTIEALREQKKIAVPVFCGVCAEQGWKPGKVVTEAEFDVAISRFMTGGSRNVTGR